MGRQNLQKFREDYCNDDNDGDDYTGNDNGEETYFPEPKIRTKNKKIRFRIVDDQNGQLSIHTKE